jgi:TDG/mug DNA glycosylase family protein
VGYNPGLESARRGHYYAFAGNPFWRQLNASGLVPRPVGPEDDATLMDLAGIGFTDLCPRPTVSAAELTAFEIREGALRLLRELEEAEPRYAVFSGKGIFEHFARHALGVTARELRGRPGGAQPERIGATVPWVIPSSSGLASRWHAYRMELLRRLAAELGAPVPPLPYTPANRNSGG